MVSITDCVSEGLKYPFNDVKKLLSLGALFAVLNILVFAISEKAVDVVRIYAGVNGTSPAIKFSQIPPSNMYIVVGLAIIGFIVALLIMGYQYDVIKFSIKRNNDLPGFGNILGLLINGIKYFIVGFLYNLIPLIVLIGGAEVLSGYNGDYIAVAIALILFIICNFLLIMALDNMVDNDKFTKAFDLREIIDKISNLGWIKYIGIVIFTFLVYAIIMVAIGMILAFISMFLAVAINHAMVISAVISVIEGLFISSYVSVFFNRVFGSIYRESIK